MEQSVESQGRDAKEEAVNRYKYFAPTKWEGWVKEIKARREAGEERPASTMGEFAWGEDNHEALEDYIEMEDIQSCIEHITKKLWEDKVEFSTLVDRLEPTVHNIRDNEEAIRSTFDRIITIRDEKKMLGKKLGELYEEIARIQIKGHAREKERWEHCVRGCLGNTEANVARMEEPTAEIKNMKVEEAEKES